MLFLAPADLRGLDGPALEELLERREIIVAAGSGEVRSSAAAALLFADYAVLDRSATLRIDSAEACAAAAWRLGRGALRLHLEGRMLLTAEEACASGCCDEWIEGEPAEWLQRWMSGRSAVALDSAAALLRLRGGDRLERAEFARLFASGVPQQGLRAFLAKAKPPF